MRTTTDHIAELRRVFVWLNDELVAAVVADLEAAARWRNALERIEDFIDSEIRQTPAMRIICRIAQAALKEQTNAST